MSRKHNTKHRRSVSNYPARLRDRGVSSRDVRMTDYHKVGVHNDGLPGIDASAAQRENVASIKRANESRGKGVR